MIRRLTLIAVLLIAGFASPVVAAAPAAKASAPDTAAVKPAKASPRPRTPRPATTASRPAAKAGAPAATTTPAARAGATAAHRDEAARRTLEDIHIEGEIPVPQVLFITSRDQRRFVGFQHRRYLRTSRKIGEATVAPSRIVVTGTETMPERSHSDE